MEVEVPIFDNEEGDWADKGEHDISYIFKLDKFYPDRVKKPLTYEELCELDED
jgi:hypothetical protein